jgi:hypothetical protein
MGWGRRLHGGRIARESIVEQQRWLTCHQRGCIVDQLCHHGIARYGLLALGNAPLEKDWRLTCRR